MGKTIALDRVIDAGAWTDAAITLIGFELPNWSVRRLFLRRWCMALLSVATAESTHLPR
jgi:hypothetical protein